MRIDKYLKLTRLIKRRTVAKELLDRGLFTINGRKAKASNEIKIGDVVVLALGRHKLTIEITNILPFAKKDDVGTLYKVLSDEIIENDQTDPQ
ncbi:MAG: RNA-binding S4 domain-containing protein [Erysipelotrichaceae bacterium]|nr:RNA-binding S4 domain-containing protein [Erysipelotrichaceae bacterium]MCB9499865.1 RNA-binding S4 domain-containing protein [Erysipelotrichaceae bacterium]